MRRTSILIVITILVGIFSSFQTATFDMTNNHSRGVDDTGFLSEIEISVLNYSSGNEISGCNIEVIDGWSGIQLGSYDVDTHPLLYLNTNQSFRFSVHCAGYASWDGAAITLDDSEGVFFSLYPLDTTINITGPEEGVSSLYVPYYATPFSTQLNDQGIGIVSLSDESNGWLYTEHETKSSIVKWNGSYSMTVPTTGQIGIFSNYNITNTTQEIVAVHNSSGIQIGLNVVDGQINTTLPTIENGSWFLVGKKSGYRLSPTLELSALQENNITDWIGTISTANTPEIPSGNLSLTINSSLEKRAMISALWSANYSVPVEWGFPALPNAEFGIDYQIDRWFGNSNSVLEQSEHSSFNSWFSQQTWVDSYYGGCCEIDQSSLKAITPIYPQIVGNSENLQFGEIGQSQGYWSWAEAGTLETQAGFTDSRYFSVPLFNDARQSANLTINLPNEWEFRFTPKSEWVSGLPWSFEVQRNLSGIEGSLPITVAKNDAPSVVGYITDYPDSSVPFGELHLDGSYSSDTSNDIGLGTTLNCEWHIWQLISGSTIQELYISNTSSNINLADSNLSSDFQPGNDLNFNLTCTDPQGLEDTWSITKYLDNSAPTYSTMITDAICMKDGEVIVTEDIFECDNITVLAGELTNFQVNSSDDGPGNVVTNWYSDKFGGWSQTGNSINLTFWQSTSTNFNFLDLGQHHAQRNETDWNLILELVDHAGNNFTHNLTIHTLDNEGPAVRVDILMNGSLLTGTDIITPSVDLVGDLNGSYDDIDSIDKVKFTIIVDDVELEEYTNASWSDVRFFEIPTLDYGYHWLNITAYDSKGNSGSYSQQITSFPITDINYEVLDITGPVKTTTGTVTFNATMMNHGSAPHQVRICFEQQCEFIEGPLATVSGAGEMTHEFSFELGVMDNIEFQIHLVDEFGNNETMLYEYEIIVEAPTTLSDKILPIFWMILPALIIVAIMHRK